MAPDGAPGPAKARREGGVTGGGYILKEPFLEIGKYETDDACDRYDIPKMLDDVDGLIFCCQHIIGYQDQEKICVWFGKLSFLTENRNVKHCTGHDCWSFVLIC